MPKYQTYGEYDPKTDNYVETAEKEVDGRDILRANEEQATQNEPSKEGFYKKNTDTAETANKREAQGASFSSQVTGTKGKMKGGRFTKRFAPLLFILGVTGAGAVGIGVSQVMMPFHVIESLTEMTDGSFTARSARMPSLVRWLFNMEGETKYTKEMKTLFGSPTTRYRKSINPDRVKTRLKNEGVDVDSSGGTTVLRYTNAKGDTVEVSADDYQRVYREDADFRNKMNRGGRSFLGRIAAHIDVTLANFLNSHSLTKNLFKNWINKIYDAEGQTVRLHDVIEARSPTTAGDVRAQESDYEGQSNKRTDIDTDADTETLGKNYKSMITDIASITTSATCGAAVVASAVTAAKVVIAYENARGAFSGIAESVDKVKAGNGDTSPINASADTMMKRDSDGLTMLQSESMKWALSGGTYTTSTSFIIGCAVANIATAAISVIADIATLGTFSVGKLLIGAAVGVGATLAIQSLTEMLVENAKTNFCLDASGPKAGACMYLGAAKYNGQNFQAGGGSPATKEKAGSFYDQYKIALADEAELIRSTKSPFDTSTSHTFLGSIMSKLGMIAIESPSLSGMASVLTNLTSTSLADLMPGASAVDKFSYFANQLRDDCTNLQFGNIQALGDLNCEPVFITDQSVNSGKTVGLAVVPDESTPVGASGIDPEEIFMFLADYKSVNEKTGAEEYQFLRDENGNLKLDNNGNEQINPDSDLGKYISYCAYRSSPFGHIDQNIMSAESQTVENSTLGAILNAIPILGDLLQMYEGGMQLTTIGWSSGVNCVARNDGDSSTMSVTTLDSNGNSTGGATAISVKSWNSFMRYAQAYVADDRFMETSYEDYVSPVQTFAENQRLVASDNKLSMVEYLAKYSGYTVENMQIALNELEYWTYVAQYEPEDKGPVVFDTEDAEVYDFELPGREIYEDYEEQIASVRQHVIYADLRNRYTAVA